MPLKGGKRKTRRNYKKKTFRRKQKKRKTRRKSRKSKKRRTRRRRKRKMVGGDDDDDEVEKEKTMKQVSLKTNTNIDKVKQAIESVKHVIVNAEYGNETGEEKIQKLNQKFDVQLKKLNNAIKDYAPAFPVIFLSERTAGYDRVLSGSKPKIIKYYYYDKYDDNKRKTWKKRPNWGQYNLEYHELLLPEIKIAEKSIKVDCELGGSCRIKEGKSAGEILNVKKAIDLVNENGNILNNLKEVLKSAKTTMEKEITEKMSAKKKAEEEEMKEKIEKHKLEWDNAQFFAAQLPSGWSELSRGQEFSWDKLNANNMTPEKVKSFYETLKNGLVEKGHKKYLAQLFYLYLFKRDGKDGLKYYPRPEYLESPYQGLKVEIEEQSKWSEEQLKNIQIKNE